MTSRIDIVFETHSITEDNEAGSGHRMAAGPSVGGGPSERPRHGRTSP